jgi:hypothetical protein
VAGEQECRLDIHVVAQWRVARKVALCVSTCGSLQWHVASPPSLFTRTPPAQLGTPMLVPLH